MFTRISLIVPTRGRPAHLARFLTSLASTVHEPHLLEVVLVVDADDRASALVDDRGLDVRQVVVPPGLRMGALNRAGYEHATGDILMLLNDDVVARTLGWDDALRQCFGCFEDGILLVHVNDAVFQKALCTFPAVSRRWCELAGGICPDEYRRYRIDDHIEDVFNMLGVLGERRSFYLPDVVFEHFNHTTNEHGVRQYFAEESTLRLDDEVFRNYERNRKQIALRLKSLIAGTPTDTTMPEWSTTLARIDDPHALRQPERLRVLYAEDLQRAIPRREPILHDLRYRMRRKFREAGYGGVARAVVNRFLRTLSRAG